jgi:hypothetical protein
MYIVVRTWLLCMAYKASAVLDFYRPMPSYVSVVPADQGRSLHEFNMRMVGEMEVLLTSDEMGEIFKQAPHTARDGGFQGLLVGFQRRIDRTTGRLLLTTGDAYRIKTYAFRYRNGGWENRLRRAFGRTLGPNLDGFVAG